MTHKKILIVDDESVHITLLDQLLNPLHLVYFSKTGLDAVDKAIQLTPDLILLDLILPDINGFEVCQELKEHRQTEDIPVVIVSAVEPSEHKKRSMS